MERLQLIATGRNSIALGKQGENNVREIVFPQPEQLMAYDWVLNHQRATDKVAYPCPLEKRGNSLVWVVTSGDTEVPGTGLAELTCNGPDGEVLKSQTYSTVTIKSPSAGGDIPDPVKPWYQMITAQLRGKMDEPEAEGEAGQVLATDGNGYRYWMTIQGGGTIIETDETLTLKDGVLSVNTATKAEQDNTLPITSAAVATTVGNIETLLKTI